MEVVVQWVRTSWTKRLARVVRLEWERWDQVGGQPQQYPPGGEPEDYILGRPHDPALAAQIGPVWEVLLADTGQQAGAGLVRDPKAPWLINASPRARDWLLGRSSSR